MDNTKDDAFLQSLANQPIENQPIEQAQQGEEYFRSRDNLEVIKEYNSEILLPNESKKDLWGLATKSISLGFWSENDQENMTLFVNRVKLSWLMGKAKHSYSFEDRHRFTQMELFAWSNFKRGVGMEKYKINERTLQATSVTQNIQASANTSGQKGVMAFLKNAFS